MKHTKTLLSLILALLLIVGVQANTLAEGIAAEMPNGHMERISGTQPVVSPNSEDQGEPPGGHMHNYVRKSEMYTYVYENSSTHIVEAVTVYECTTCGGRKLGEIIKVPENHFAARSEYNGTNYHSGNLHYFQMNIYCACGHFMGTVWLNKVCSGNGGHVTL